MNLTPVQKLKQYIIFNATDINEESLLLMSGEAIEQLYEALDFDLLIEVKYDLREGDFKTHIHDDQHLGYYQGYSVASTMLDGSDVGWTCWYGGGPHGEASYIDWVSGAYAVDCKEEIQVVKVYSKSNEN